MKKTDRYSTAGMIEDQYEPDSEGKVLKNLLGIKTREEIDRVETELLLDLTSHLLDEYAQGHRFTAKDICRMHQGWLGQVYQWAGKYRQVLMGKGGFVFAAPAQIPKLMLDFEENCLARHTPCVFEARQKIVTALAEVHTELVLIHPFREGNGRLSRLVATLMALQAGLPPLDFSELSGKRLEEYFAAVRAGMERNYRPMEKAFESVISRTLKSSGK